MCSSMKVSLCIYQLFMHSFSLTDDVYSLFHLQHCLQSVTVSTIQYSNAYHSIYNGFNINNYYIHYYKNVFAHKRYYYAYDSNATSTSSFSASMFRVHKCACVINSTWVD